MSESTEQPAPAEPAPEPVASPVATATLPPMAPPAPALPAGYAPPPLMPPFLRTKWPGPAGARGLAVPIAVLLGALGFAVFVPLSRTGIGWFLGGLVAVGATVAGLRSARAANPGTNRGTRGERAIRTGWAVSSLALLSVLAFRNAWWLVTFCVLGALGCATLAVIGGRSIRSILFSLVAAPFAALRSLPWLARHLDTRRAADADGESRGANGARIITSVVVTVIILLIFGALFASADAAFSQVLDDLIPEVNADTVVAWVFLFVVGALTTAAAIYTIAAPPNLSGMDSPGSRRLSRIEWGLPITALVVLFAGFVAVQVTVLFGGERHVLQTAGLTYAEYARSGFWQLVAATILTLIVISGVTRWARQEVATDRMVLRILLGLLSALSIVVVASALYRMYTYQQVYSFTGERIFVMAFELLLGTVFIMVLVAGIRWRGAWIPRLIVGLAVVMLLGLAALNPEDYAARRNVQRYHDTGKIDLWYLRALSADATPALATLPAELRGCTLSWIVPKLNAPDPWYGWNLGRQRARDTLAALGPGAAGTCADADRFDFPKQD